VVPFSGLSEEAMRWAEKLSLVDGVNQHGRSSDNHLGRFRGMNVVV